MSVSAMSWAWKQELDPTTKFVLLALADHANDIDFTCWPSLTHLELKTGLSRPTIWKAVDRLENIGLTRRAGIHQTGATLYEVIVGEEFRQVSKLPSRQVTKLPSRQVSTLPGVGNHVNGVGNVGNKLGNDVTPNHKNHHESSITIKRFTPPSVEEVKTYCQERKNGIDPQSFVDHYQASGWVRGKTKIKDWRACVRTWEKNKKDKEKPKLHPDHQYAK